MKTPQLHPLLIRIMPFLVIAFAIIIFVLTLFVFSYVFIFAMIVGLILFAIGYIRSKFSKEEKNASFREQIFIIQRHMRHQGPSETKKPAHPHEHTGRIIEHDKEDK